ncbi:MAG: ATP-binding protein [Spirosomataceae bacterium]
MFPRTITQQLLEDLSFFPVVGIVGPRQVGKTTLAKYLQSQLEKPTLYLDLELDTDVRRFDDAETFLKTQADKCIIIDEIQRMPRLFPLLRALIDMDRRPTRFILLGSASPDLIRGTSETLAGRIAYTELTPLSLVEVQSTIPMREHWLRGGFPVALSARRITQSFRWVSSFIQTFIQRDLPDLGYGVSTETFGKLLEMLSHLQGSTLVATDLGRSLGVSSPTVSRYLDLLEGSFMISRLQPYHANVSKRLVKTPKVYLRDSGILHQLARINSHDQLLAHPLVGASWEGYVLEQIRRVAGNDWQYYFYRTQVGAEVDLVLISPTGKKICIEIKLSNSPIISKGFYESIKDIRPDFQYVIVPEDRGYSKADGTIVGNLSDFLNLHLPKISET